MDVKIKLPEGVVVDGDRVYYITSKAADRRASFSGSGIPYVNAAQAFQGTRNHGYAEHIGGNTYKAFLPEGLPGSYYESDMSGRLVPPVIHVRWRSNGQNMRSKVKIAEAIPFRSSTLPYRGDSRTVSFYDDTKYPVVRSQEAILIASAYPALKASTGEASEPDNFWGTKPRR
jgi:hypothetical protein